MGAFSDSTGAGGAFGPRFTGTNLSRYNNALIFSLGMDDPVSSTEAVGLVGGCPIGSVSLISGAATFGSTSIIGSGTSVAVTSSPSAPRFTSNLNYVPAQNSDHTLSFWFQGSVDPLGSRNLIGWTDPGASGGRILYGWRDANESLYVLDVNNNRLLYTLPTNYATDLGDGSPHNIVFRYLAGAWDCFVDGTKGTTVTAAWAAQPTETPGVEFTLFEDLPLDGSYAHVSGWSAGLSDAAVAELYNSGSGRFADGT